NAGIQIGIFISATEGRAHALPDLLVGRIDLRQSKRCNERTYQPLSGQIYAFGERTTQHRKTQAAASFRKALQKRFAFGFEHMPGLFPNWNAWVAAFEQGCQLLQIVEAAQKDKIVARLVGV